MNISPAPWSIKETDADIFIAASNDRVVVQIGCQAGELQLQDAKFIVSAVSAAAEKASPKLSIKKQMKFEAIKNKGGTFDIFIDGVNLGVFDDVDGKMVYFPKRNEQITGDHYILIGHELNKWGIDNPDVEQPVVENDFGVLGVGDPIVVHGNNIIFEGLLIAQKLKLTKWKKGSYPGEQAGIVTRLDGSGKGAIVVFEVEGREYLTRPQYCSSVHCDHPISG